MVLLYILQHDDIAHIAVQLQPNDRFSNCVLLCWLYKLYSSGRLEEVHEGNDSSYTLCSACWISYSTKTWSACNKKVPTHKLGSVWENLSAAPVPESTLIAWFRVIHDLIPKHERLQRIRTVQTDTCRKCTMKDTLEHRITACGEGRDIWEHSKSLIAKMLRTILARISDDWLLHSQFQIWSPKTS